MTPLATAIIVFGSVFSAALTGMGLRSALPEHHLTSETKDAVRIGMGLVATLSALLLGLLVATAKGSYDTQKKELQEMAAKVAYLDQTLSNYGPETQDIRHLVGEAVEAAMARIWNEKGDKPPSVNPHSAWGAAVPKAIQGLSPKDDSQRTFKTQAARTAGEIAQMRWLLVEQASTSIPRILLIVLVAWLAIVFSSIGLFAKPNSTAIVALMLVALSLSGAVLLILELDHPFGGLIRIPSEPMRKILIHIQ
jgi:hypothetical protein